MISRSHRPCMDAWKAWAAPWKLVVMVAGSICRASFCTAATASPRAIPGFRLKEMVTAGSCPDG